MTRVLDLLGMLFSGALVSEPLLNSDEMFGIRLYSEVLCWALGHQHNTSFMKLIDAIEQNLKEAGYVYNAEARALYPLGMMQ